LVTGINKRATEQQSKRAREQESTIATSTRVRARRRGLGQELQQQ